MEKFFVFFIIGLATSAVYAVSATGLVVTYLTSGVFNFAHGAIGMFLAFVYWELSVSRGWPVVVSLAVTLLVVAPLLGVLLDVLVMRRLVAGASVATKLVVTLALLLAFQGLALAIWGIELRTLPEFFPDREYELLGLVISWHQTITILTALVVAFGLRQLFRRTRLGVAMRAVVDSPELCATKGLSPNVVTGASWAMGSMLAGLAAILIAPGLNLEVNTLSLLVVSAYAAAVLGRLQNLPMTFAGAVILGVSQSMVVAYLPSSNEWVQNLRPALPFLLLFAALLARGELRLPEKAKTHSEPAPPSLRLSMIVGAAAVVLAIPAAQLLGRNPSQLLTASSGLAFAAIAISLVLLTGLSGQVSLMHMSFVGIGAIVVGKLGADFPYLLAIAIAAVVAGLVGAVVALPAIRLRGVYLALSTLAFAIMLDELVFGNSDVLGGGSTIAVSRPSIGGWKLDTEEWMFVVLTIVVVVFANVFLAVRRTKFGRMLAAMRDSPGASQMIGMNVTAQKLKVFSLSAGMAGFAGALFGGLQARVGQLDFLWFRSLSVLLVATIFGITSVSGALLGAFFFVVLPDVLREISEGGDSTSVTLAFQPLIIGLLAILTARRPEGVAGRIRERLRPFLRRTPLIETEETAEPAREVARAGT